MARRGGFAWWVLFALLPLMGGLLVLEHRAPLPHSLHTLAQLGIVLFIYGLVWLWLRAHTLAQLRISEKKPATSPADEANRRVMQPFRPRLPRPASGHYVRAHQTTRRMKAKAYRTEINKCSLN